MSDMPSARWDEIKALFAEAIEMPPAARATWIAQLSPDDASLRAELDALIRAHDESGDFLETPALATPAIAQAVVDVTTRASGGPAAPEHCGAYRIVRELGRGGMGVVYLGARDDDRFEKLAAIKVMASDVTQSVLAQRFQEERRILASLDHPNIARLLDAGTTDTGVPYVVMEYVEGQSIDVYCATRRLPIRERLALFVQVCAAVQYSHQHLVVHRDLKPRNILVTADGVPKLLDFGIAKLIEPAGIDTHVTRTAFRALTPESASPEQVRGETVAVSTDVYSLGVLLYRLLTGRSPYRGDMQTEAGIVRAICDETPLPPSEAIASQDEPLSGLPRPKELAGDVDTITLKALRKDPARRYGTVEQMADDVARHLTGRPILARPDTVAYRTTKFVTRHKVGVAASVLVVVSLVGGVIATAWEAHLAEVQRARAERRFNDVRRLANSFLFEFHDAIEPLPGSTKARELVVRRAKEYLDSLSTESANDASLQRELASAYDKVGDVQGLPQFANLGDTAGALESHRRALALRETLGAASPSDRGLQSELVTTYSHLSAIDNVMKDMPAALDHARKALAIRQALMAAKPDGVSEQRSLAIGYNQIGGLMSQSGNWAAALDNFQRETKAFEALLALDPGNSRAQRDVAISYRQLGALLERNGDAATALSYYRKGVVLDEARTRANANDGQAQLDLSFGYASIGFTLSQAGDVAGALDSYQQALSARERVSAADSHDVNAQDAVIRAHSSIGRVLRSAKRFPEALAHFRQAMTIAAGRHAADPINGAVSEQLANVYGSLAGTTAGLARTTGNSPDATHRWREALAWIQKAREIWADKQLKGALSAAGKTELDSLVTLQAQCDAALAKIGGL